LASLSLLGRLLPSLSVDDSAIAIGRERKAALASLTARRRGLPRRSSTLPEHRSRSRDHEYGSKSKGSSSHCTLLSALTFKAVAVFVPAADQTCQHNLPNRIKLRAMNLILFAALLLSPQDDLKQLQAVFNTSAGTFVIEFYPDEAPNHVRKFIELARQGFYSGTIFHNMFAHGAVQGGDPETRNPQGRAKYGTGGFNMGLKPEFSKIPFVQGTVAATLLPNQPGSAGSEFFIVVADQPQFTGQFTAFGHVVEGIEVVDKISMTPVDDKQIAKERIEIKDVAIRTRPVPAPPPFTEETVEELSQQRVVMETAQGNIVIEMLPDKAPNHVRHFLRLTALGAYDKTAFHRIAPGFVIQAGDLNTRSEPIPQTAQKYVVRIRAEVNDVKHQAGIVSMARGEEIDSALTSFFIVLGNQPALDGTYTVFGRVVEGMDVVEKIAATPAENERPKERVDIYRMRVERRK
jgi:peptidyl-prolyl cis-trans isomerase B (cyclophilin B)